MTKPSKKDFLKDLMDIKVQVEGNVFEMSLADVLKIDSDLEGLNQNFIKLPLDYGMWLMMEMKAIRRVEQIESALADHEAELYIKLPEMIEKKGKKPTVDAIKAYILTDGERIDLAKELSDARHDKSLVTAGCRALQYKKDCALELARNMRAEMDMTGGPVVKARKRMDEVYNG
jgi:hypothetical protein